MYRSFLLGLIAALYITLATSSAVGKMFAGMMQDTTSAEDVANVIYNAAIDPSNKLRYIAGTENFKTRMIQSNSFLMMTI